MLLPKYGQGYTPSAWDSGGLIKDYDATYKGIDNWGGSLFNRGYFDFAFEGIVSLINGHTQANGLEPVRYDYFSSKGGASFTLGFGLSEFLTWGLTEHPSNTKFNAIFGINARITETLHSYNISGIDIDLQVFRCIRGGNTSGTGDDNKPVFYICSVLRDLTSQELNPQTLSPQTPLTANNYPVSFILELSDAPQTVFMGRSLAQTHTAQQFADRVFADLESVATADQATVKPNPELIVATEVSVRSISPVKQVIAHQPATKLVVRSTENVTKTYRGFSDIPDLYPDEVKLHGFDGDGFIADVVQIQGAPAARKVRLYHRASGKLVRETFSKPDGSYRFDNLDTKTQYYAVALDYTKTFNTVSQDGLKAQVAS